jgi:hypothetical protein
MKSEKTMGQFSFRISGIKAITASLINASASLNQGLA